jgi:hypothetical protein
MHTVVQEMECGVAAAYLHAVVFMGGRDKPGHDAV